MNYSFEFNSSAMGRIQPFEYSYATTNEYAFTYSRDILSDLSKFNAPIFVARKRRGIFSYDKTLLAKRTDSEFRIQDDIKHGIKNNNGFVIHDELSINEERNEVFTLDDTFANKYILLIIFKDILAHQDSNGFNIYDNYFGEKYIPKKITIVKLKGLNKYFSLEVYDDYFLTNYDKELNVYRNIILNKPISKLNVYDNLFVNRPDNILSIYKTISLNRPINNLNIHDDINLYKPINELSIYDDYMVSRIKDDILSIYNYYYIERPVKEMSINSNTSLSRINSSNMFIKNDISIAKITSKLDINLYKQVNVKINSNDFSISDFITLSKKYKNLHDIEKNIYMSLNPEKTYLYKELSTMIKQKKKTSIQYKIPKLAKYKKRFIKSRDIILGYHAKRKFCFRKENLFVYKFNHDIFIKEDIVLSKDKHKFIVNKTESFLESSKKEFIIKDDTEFLYKDRHEFTIKNDSIFLYKDRHGFRIFHDDLHLRQLDKIRKGFRINDTEVYLYKDRHGFSISNTNNYLKKERKGFSINDTETYISKIRKGFVIDNYTDFIYRDKYHISINITDAVLTKSELPVGIIIHNNTIGLIMSEKDLYKEQDNQFLSIKSKNTFSNNTELFLERDIKRTDTLNNLFVITERKKAFIEYYHNLMLSKNAKSCLINMSNAFVEKESKHDIIYENIINVTKHYKKAFIENTIVLDKNTKELFVNHKNLFLDKIIKHIYLYKNIYVDAPLKNITLTNEIWINKNIYLANVFKDDFVSKDIYEAYITENDISVNKAEYEAIKNTYLSANIKQKELYKSKETSLTKEINKANVNNYIFITKHQYETNEYVSEMMHMQKIIKDLEKPVEKTYNWAYVYQYEDPIDPNYDYYGIDELLLPEKDIDYSSFEEAIFNKKTMMPRKPIKIIDNNTFIAKYPIKHPTPDYEEIGIVYIDVPTDLMYTIFTKFYQVWYANIFKFGNMSMVDSLKLMLDYMYSYIVTTYSGSEYLEPALRVFRQIRWFGETSVMHNAQYKITCEYEDLKSNLQTGECMIKNQLSGFYVDTNLKVLSTESTSIGHEAYIKLYASNREDSQITFSVSFTGGAIDVYINGLLVDTIYSNHSLISYDLPATDDENEIILKRSASNNIGYCYIGNIIIKKGTYKNLNIEYDPELKAGNMPLNDIVNKMVILANMYDDEQEAFNKFREGNLAVSELYKRLENYWELHHANKIKGKRLTIKET